MKTPREILMEQHRSANAKLDALRANVVATTTKSRETISLGHVWVKLWRELFWPCRHAWTGLTAVWILLWVISQGMSGSQTGTIARRPLTFAAVQTVQEQRRLLAELIPPPPKAEPAVPPKSNRPRSQRPSWLFKV